ncbi:MAG TPA: glycosyltransferase [Clostridia bacterium]|nr:glycosyltransferase [Clostridia bacterium]
MKKIIKKICKKVLKRFRIVTQDDLKNVIDSIELVRENNNKFSINNTYRLEKELYKSVQNLEYKLNEFNSYTNIILYENQIDINNITGNTRPNFNPKVSIIIPVYNGKKYIREAIDSALKQTYKNIEIIVVNDGSNDNGESENIALSYGDKIRYFKKENGGVSSALNLGIKNMKGEYFAWLSHDDLYYKNNIEEHIRYLKNTLENNIITFTGFDIIDENSNLRFNETIISNLYCFDYKISKIKTEYSLLKGEINGGSVLIPKNAFEEFGLFNEKLKISQEREMWSRLISKYKFINIPYNTNSIRTHDEQVTNQNKNVLLETNMQRSKIIDNIKKEKREELEKSEYNFLVSMLKYYEMNNIEAMTSEIRTRIEKLR